MVSAAFEAMDQAKPNITAPAISVLVPIYNVEAYLEECLNSLKDQTFTDFEVICINDGSTDGSRDIIQRYLDTDHRFKVIDKPNSGYGASMNQGLSAATGTYIAILESDDIFEADALEHLYQLAESYDAQLAKADFWLYWSKPEVRLEQFHVIPEGAAGHLLDPKDEPEIFYQKPSIWSGLYRRDFLKENAIDFLETPGAAYQDASFNFKTLASADRAIFSDKPILKYRQDNEQSSVNSPGKVYCACDEYVEMERFLQDRPDMRAKLEGIKERMKFDTYMWNYDRLSEELRAEFLVYAANELRADLDRGDLDLSLFEPWAEADLHALLDDSENFQEVRAKFVKSGKLNTFRHYFKLGGFPLIFKLLAFKVNRKRSG